MHALNLASRGGERGEREALREAHAESDYRGDVQYDRIHGAGSQRTWIVSRSSVGEEMAGFNIMLIWDGEKLSGSIEGPDGETRTIAAGDYKDGIISFHATAGSATHQNSGTLKNSRIEGNWAAGIRIFDWKAESEALKGLGE